MMGPAVRNILLLGVTVAVAATLTISSRIAPKIQCGSQLEEGKAFYCSANLEYPPNSPHYRWSVDGECVPDGSASQTIQLLAPARAQTRSCTVRLAVYDSANDLLIGTADRKILLTPSTMPLAAPPAEPGRAPSPASAPGHPAATATKETSASLEVTAWPDWNQRRMVDDAPVQGYIVDANPKTCKVAVYTLTSDGWSLQGVTAADPITGRWLVLARLGPAYAAMLVRGSFAPEPRLRALPERGRDILFVKKTD